MLDQTEWDVHEEVRKKVQPWFDINRSAQFSVPAMSDTMNAVWLDWLLLAFFALAPIALAYFRFIHYDPR